MGEIKAGVLAVITGAFTEKGCINIGKVVMVEKIIVDGERYQAPDGKLYACRSNGKAAIIIGRQIYNITSKKYGWAQVSVGHLRSISDPISSVVQDIVKELTDS